MPPEVPLHCYTAANSQRRHIAKKSAPSHYKGTPPRSRPNDAPPSLSSPMSLDDQLKYIDKWGVNQFEACRECIQSGLGTRCFVAARVSPRCGNCLRVGKQCHFSQTIDDSVDEEEEEDEVINVELNSHEGTGRDGRATTRQLRNHNVCPFKLPCLMQTFKPIVAENLLNYDPEDDQPPIVSPTHLSTSPRVRRSIHAPAKLRKKELHTRGIERPAAKTVPSSIANHLATRPATSPSAARSSTPPLATRSTTPPLAMDKPSFDHPYAPTTSYQEPLIAGTPDLSFAEKNSIIVAMQRQINWNAVAAESGLDVDKAMKWWMRVSSELVRR